MLERSRGSPPRVWGQRGGLTNASALPRFTPTGVGTTSPKRLPTTNVVVYPHRCGDNIEYLANKEMGNGSPPRVWGQRLNRWPNLRHPRFTPTGVGTTRPSPSTTRPSTVHPHGCGDNWHPVFYCPMNFWFTPTGVGTTFGLEDEMLVQDGSPPRVWGQHPRWLVAYGLARFTPTGVGTTQSATPHSCRPAVHPHGCGDNGMDVLPVSIFDGSPPRVWGQPPNFARFPEVRTVHPHGCGDNARLHAQPVAIYRFTPTGVGTT